ncbi:MAG: hypothetical protein JEZ06_00515 [Anaerolineaceae bacterium]|nr:hypothetical protein [Anaerolineaceae bacterium]
MTNTRRLLKSKFSDKQDIEQGREGELGDGLGNVGTDVHGLVYVRVDGKKTTAVCEGIPQVDDLPVWVGYAPQEPGILRVLSQRSVGGTPPVESQTNLHGHTHEWFGAGADGGSDPVFIHTRQIKPLMVYPAGTLQVAVFPGFMPNGDNLYFVADTSGDTILPHLLDLSSYAVITSGKAKYVRISLDFDGGLVVTDGSEVDIADLDFDDIPAAPANTYDTLAAVRLYYAQTIFQDGGENTDFVDFRFSNSHKHDNSSLVLYLNDLLDADLSSETDLDLLQYDDESGKWVNRSLSAAGVAAKSTLDTHLAANNPHEIELDNLGELWEPVVTGAVGSEVFVFDATGDIVMAKVSL